MDKVKVLTIIVAIETVMLAISMAFSVPNVINGSEKVDVRSYLEDFSNDVAINSFQPTSVARPFNMTLGEERYFTVVGTSTVTFQGDPAWLGFVLVFGGSAGEAGASGPINSTIFDPSGEGMGTSGVGQGAITGIWASGQMMLREQMFMIDDGRDHWNGTWIVDLSSEGVNYQIGVMVTPILYIDAAVM